MDAWMRKTERQEAKRRRRPPGEGRVIRIPFDGTLNAAADATDPPAEIQIEATDASGESADWLTDYFWVDLLGHWADEPIAVHFLPTPAGLLHPVLLHQTYMLRRITEHWRVVGHCYVSDLADQSRVAQAAVTPYHEIRVVDGPRPGVPALNLPRIEDVIGRMRQAQSAQDRTSPVLVRCAPPTPTAVPEPPLAPTRTAPTATTTPTETRQRAQATPTAATA